MKKGLVFTTLLCALGMGLAACGPQQPVDNRTYEVTITNKEALQTEWKEGEEDSRTALFTIVDNKGTNVDYFDEMDAGRFVVTSSNTSVITVSGYGVLNCVGAGTTTITATYKNKYSDSLEITIQQERAMRPAFTLDTSKDYFLGMIPADGTLKYATGKVASTYYLGIDAFAKAAKAKVTLEEVDGDFKYSISLAAVKSDGTYDAAKVIGSAVNGTGSNKHYNIGFVGSNVPSTSPAVPYSKALFKFNTETLNLTTMIDGTEFTMGTYSTNSTISFRENADYPARIYEEGDPIHPETVKINLEESETEVVLRPGFSRKLTYTCTPDFVTDAAKWETSAANIVTVSASGLISAVGDAGQQATITLKVHKKSTTVNVKIEGEPILYGSQEEPLTIAQAKAQLDELGDNFYTTKKMYVRAVVGEVEDWNEANSNRNIWLRDGTNNKAFELYRAKDAENETYVRNMLPGQTVTAVGYGEKYVGSSTTYEFTPANGFNPGVLDVVIPELTGINVPEKITLGVDAEEEIVVTAAPEGAVLPQVSLSWKEATDVAEIVTGQLKVKGLKVGTATLVVTAGSFSEEVPVEVKSASEGVKVTKTVAQLKADNGWANGDVVNSVKIGEVTVTMTGNSGDTKYYDSGSNLRIYLTATNGTGSVAFAATEGYTIVSVKVTFVWNKNTGTFELESDKAVEVNATSKSFAIANTASASEQLRITAFEIVYAQA